MNSRIIAVRRKSEGCNRRIRWFRFWLIAIFQLANFLNGWSPARAAITLTSLDALAGDGSVLIRWTTATEPNNSGFNVLKSDQPDGTYERINETLIFATGNVSAGGTYQHEDVDVVNGTTYYYKLEAIDINNQSALFGPISAVPGVATVTPTTDPNATATLTITPGPSPTATPTLTITPGPSPTASITTTPALTRTASPVPSSTPLASATATIAASATNTPIATPTASATLIPLPQVTFTYPAPSATARPTNTPLPAATEPPSEGGGSGGPSSALRIGLLASIVLLWVLLGGWLYIFLYRSGM